MSSFAEPWLAYLLLSIILFGLALFNQLARIKRLLKGKEPVNAFSEGLTSLIFFAFGGALFFVLFVCAFLFYLFRG